MQHVVPPYTEDSIGPSAAQYQQTFDPGQYRGDPKAGQSAGRLPAPRVAFIVTGVTLLAMLCIVPVCNAGALMSDDNYVFWVGRVVPVLMLMLMLGLVVLYVVVELAFFGLASSRAHSEQTTMMVANIFVTLLGLILVLLSLPLTRQAVETYTTLMHQCEFSEQTHRLYEYSQVLQNIRASPECAGKYSVEECSGYEDAAPFTAFLKTMETSFRCAGFCYHPAGAAQAASFQLFGPAPGNSFCGGDYLASTGAQTMLECQARCADDERCKYFSYWSTGKKTHWCHMTASCDAFGKDKDQVIWIYSKQKGQVASNRWDFAQEEENTTSMSAVRHRRVDRVTRMSMLQVDGTVEQPLASVAEQPLKTSTYPPTLFSDANYQASCEGMAARDMKNFAGEIGSQTFYQGVYLVFISIITGFLKLVGFCVRREQIDKVLRG